MSTLIECACADCVKRKKKGLNALGQVELIESEYLPEGLVKLQIQQVSLKAIDEAKDKQEFLCFDQSTHVALDANGLVELIKGAKKALNSLLELEEK